MPVLFPEAIIVALLSIFLFLAMCAALVLIILSLRRPSTVPLIAAGVLVLLALIVVVVSPVNVPLLMGLIVALLGTAVAVLGGNPVTRRILEIATHGRVRDGANGGIMLDAQAAGVTDGAEPTAPTEVLRGGTTIGYLERLAVVMSLIVGFPEALAIVVAIKGVGRFSELAAAEARERFIIGTLSSLLWACIVGALVRLAIW
ncbi:MULTISPECIES: hypothetical protein [unclassified Microbacterium]|uniref:hypothetical protein n=1 Tax=unclassified Microbacterium TaxID=2609290 RepID=UPI00214C0EE6|nr:MULTISPECIES: hypothetical protein [unclassified Microbacterium]MCR2809976.1 hypothetical protein [Microbacterium sp. zg.B185]WIM20181.1 hypothetical protein QNO12_05070 [Microbacterium sp. zg-B185]